ncbi:MAG: PTS system mannose/fructose/sorbose family transporter subunit IID [Elusimicrobiota bacterium]
MSEFWKVFLRSFFLQAGWNYMKFQNLGFIFSIDPILKKIYYGEELKKAYLRHCEIFNTQPYMAGFILGNIAGMEERQLPGEQIVKIKQSLACAYASIGDRIFWARLRISVYLTTIILYFVFTLSHIFSPARSAFFALLLPTTAYALFSVYIRWKGIKKGYECSGSGSCGLDFINWNRLIKSSSKANFLALLCVLSFAVFSAVAYRTGFSKDNTLFAFEFLFVVSAVFMQRYFKQQKKPLTWTLAACFIFALIFAAFKKFLA